MCVLDGSVVIFVCTILHVDGHASVSVCVCVVFILFYFCLDPPSVTSLIVNGNEVNGDYIINERKEISISCFVDKGNPQVSFQLLDKYGSELKSDINGGHLNYLLTARCEDDWPMIRCEGSRSVRNRSVSFLVRCKISNVYFLTYIALVMGICFTS